ncbi:NADP-dependent oxidoreductase [Granulicella tundricola]|uniref:Alcohol dehydrogenase zinc-binding domain protein n=1 Tax=Granulicella tundricola (strain ATCC BAA-1859 / DSM 23138 / MP5ACTX9) TaxID=1198114 RepID=E8X603_GRATM|nr:NADP-dependent oxidoreductase [Granulicella tundricola]ADW70887.1 Alcohol dehydrogenase zinc-binding domain protein [Granulicella tundricola MP5ACTX9]
MKAARLADPSRSSELDLEDVDLPLVGRGEILVRVAAAGVTPSELLWYPTTHTKEGERRIGVVPGHEFSGIVEAIGAGVHGFFPGDKVFGMNDWFSQGASAEYCIASPLTLAPKPRTLSYAEAAAVPIGALTAWQALFDRADLQAGERVLVHGGAGAVGTFVIQLAKLHGAEVIATASAANMDFLTSLKADEVINYRATRFEDQIEPVDVLFDAIGGETLQRSWPLLRAGGRAITVAAQSEGVEDARIKAAFFIVDASREQLLDIGLLIDGGSLRPFVGAAVPLSAAADAYGGRIARKDGRGKVVLLMPDFEEKDVGTRNSSSRRV